MVDDDSAVLKPAALIDAVVELAPEQERLEGWIMQGSWQGHRYQAYIRLTPRTKHVMKQLSPARVGSGN